MDERTLVRRQARSSTDVLAFYDQYAPDWDARFGSAPSVSMFHRARLASFLKLAHLSPTDRVVELGAGTGIYLETIAPLVREVVCVDGSARMLDLLAAKHAHLPNVRTVLVDLEQPIASAFDADLLYAFGLIEHIIDIDAFMANCRRCLQSGKRLVIVGANGRSPWYGWLRRPWRVGAHCSSDRYFTVQQLDRAARAHGFVAEGVEYWGYFPAGAGAVTTWVLGRAGALLARTPLRVYAGGFARSYRLDAAPAAGGDRGATRRDRA